MSKEAYHRDTLADSPHMLQLTLEEKTNMLVSFFGMKPVVVKSSTSPGEYSKEIGELSLRDYTKFINGVPVDYNIESGNDAFMKFRKLGIIICHIYNVKIIFKSIL